MLRINLAGDHESGWMGEVHDGDQITTHSPPNAESQCAALWAMLKEKFGEEWHKVSAMMSDEPEVAPVAEPPDPCEVPPPAEPVAPAAPPPADGDGTDTGDGTADTSDQSDQMDNTGTVTAQPTDC